MLSAQSLQINEVLSSNTNYFDEDGDSPDWIELYHTGNSDIFLEGWTISDDAAIPEKWTFPKLTLSPDNYLVLWASGKDRSATGTPRTLIAPDNDFKYLVPTQNLANSWTSLNYDDASWLTGSAGFGYGDQDDTTMLPAGTRSIFLRKTFPIDDPAQVEELLLHLDYDDGFVAYLNGVEVARDNIDGNPPAYNAGTITDHEANIYQGGSPDLFIIDQPADLLVAGENILSIQAHNISANSSDFSIIPFLTAYFSVPSALGQTPPTILGLENRFLHTNFKLNASGETLYLFDANTELVDSLLIPPLPINVSIGIPVGGTDFLYYDIPSPGFSNATAGFFGITDAKIVFSHPGGSVNPFSLSLSGTTAPEQIRYTLDATLPHQNSPLYTGSISINQNQVVRASIFRSGYLSSTPQSHTYFLNANHQLPIAALVTEPDNLFDDDTGIYVLGNAYDPDFPFFGANFWEDWERPMHFSFYEASGELGTSFAGGAKIFGGWSRANDQRSFSLFARKEYGSGEIEYPLFPELDYESFQALVLRNSGNDWLSTNVRDVILTGLMKDSGLDYQAARSVATYINGEYWGLYHLREKVNEHFLASKHGIEPEVITILEANGQVIQGSNQEYQQLVNFVNFNDLSDADNYQQVKDQIDMDNYLTYQVAQIYFSNTDWPGNNIKFWKAPNSKWRWILFDTDFSFNRWEDNAYAFNTLNFALEANGPGWPNPPWATFLFRNLTENEEFRHAFVNRFADALNSRFLSDRVVERIDTVLNSVGSEMPSHLSRWGGMASVWQQQAEVMRGFAQQRPPFQKAHILFQFGLPDYHALSIKNDDPSEGQVQINSLTIKASNWSGDYFEEVPVQVTAVPAPGYFFSHWSGGNTSTDAEIYVDLKGPMELTPHFSAGTEEKELVINEINYNAKPDWNTGDWIELYNPNVQTLDLSAWILQDEKEEDEFIFPSNTWIEGKGFLIICKDLNKFQLFYPGLSTAIGNLDFGLSSDGDAVRLFDPSRTLHDEVYYLPDSPWPPEANGNGPTLELIDPKLDNSLPESWVALSDLGSPGQANGISTGQADIPVIQQWQFYPNPAQDQVFFNFTLSEPTEVEVVLYRLDGQKERLLFRGDLEAGAHYFHRDIAPLAVGMYLLKWKSGAGEARVEKWIKAANYSK